MGKRWHAERERLHIERELHQRQRREALEQQLQGEAAAADAAAWAAEADPLAIAAAAQMEAEEAEEDDDDFDWSDYDGPDPEEAAVQQLTLVESFESQKKLQDDAHTCEEELICRAVELSLQAEKLGRAGDDALNDHRRLLAMLRKERRRAAQELRWRGDDDGTGLSDAPSGGH